MIERGEYFKWVNKNGKFFVTDTEWFELKEALWDFNKEVIVIVHLFDNFYNVRDELISDSVVSKNSSNDGYFGSSIKFETSVVTFEFLDIDCTVLLLTIVETHSDLIDCIWNLKFIFHFIIPC